MPLISNEPATPKNDVVNEPGMNVEISLMLVTSKVSRNSALTELTDRGVSRAVLSNPKTELTGSLGNTPKSSSISSSAV